MFDISNIRAGQIATFVLGGEPKMNKTIPTEDGREPNPLFGRVTRRQVQVGNVCGRETYQNKYPEAPGARNWFEWTDKPGVVRHRQTGAEYIAILPTNCTTQYFVDGREATEEERAVIALARPSRDEPAKFIVMKRENLENLA